MSLHFCSRGRRALALVYALRARAGLGAVGWGRARASGHSQRQTGVAVLSPELPTDERSDETAGSSVARGPVLAAGCAAGRSGAGGGCCAHRARRLLLLVVHRVLAARGLLTAEGRGQVSGALEYLAARENALFRGWRRADGGLAAGGGAAALTARSCSPWCGSCVAAGT